jgi:hypothetical protein
MQFNIFAPKVVQVGVHEIVEVTYKPIATINQSNLECTLPANSDFYDFTDHTGVTNNLLHSLFSQCRMTEWYAHNTKYPKLQLPRHVGNSLLMDSTRPALI